MKTRTPGFRYQVLGELTVPPDSLVVPLHIQARGPAEREALATVRRICEAIAHKVVHLGATLQPRTARTREDKGSASALFSRREGVCVVNASFGVHTRLEDDADFWDRAEQTATLLATLRQLTERSEEAELTLGEPRYVLEEPERHRPAVVAEVRERILQTSGGLLGAPSRITRVELTPRLQVEVLGSVEAVVRLEATVTLEAETAAPD